MELLHLDPKIERTFGQRKREHRMERKRETEMAKNHNKNQIQLPISSANSYCQGWQNISTGHMIPALAPVQQLLQSFF